MAKYTLELDLTGVPEGLRVDAVLRALSDAMDLTHCALGPLYNYKGERVGSTRMPFIGEN